MRKRLKPHEAKYLGKEIKEHTPDGHPRYNISESDWKKIQDLRASKNRSSEKNEVEAKPFVLSAWNILTGGLLDINEYCKTYNLPIDDVRSYKLVTHTGVPFYNIQFKEDVLDNFEYSEFKDLLFNDLNNIKVKPLREEGERIGVVKIADLHFGSYVDNLIKTHTYSIDILCNKLAKAAEKINRYKFKEVHIHLLGDLIESFTGLNHSNSWKSLDKKMIGAEAVKLATKCIHDYLLSRINNLASVKIVAGNHDRVTSNKDEDTEGGAANLIAWGLELIGYNVEFNSTVISHYVDGIMHVITHGHLGISKRSTKDIIWDYGKQGVYNLVCEGHLHSIIEKLSVSQRRSYQTIKDDSVDHRRFNCPSFFTGNSYSEQLGYTSNAGFVITYNDGEDVPEIDYKTV